MVYTKDGGILTLPTGTERDRLPGETVVPCPRFRPHDFLRWASRRGHTIPRELRPLLDAPAHPPPEIAEILEAAAERAEKRSGSDAEQTRDQNAVPEAGSRECDDSTLMLYERGQPGRALDADELASLRRGGGPTWLVDDTREPSILYRKGNERGQLNDDEVALIAALLARKSDAPATRGELDCKLKATQVRRTLKKFGARPPVKLEGGGTSRKPIKLTLRATASVALLRFATR